MKKNKKGFSLVEILIVMAIVAILAGVVVVVNGESQKKSRDAERKAELLSIKASLDLYYSVHGKYPPAGSCPMVNCYVYSNNGTDWIPALAAENGSLPVDPINRLATGAPANDGPWTDGNFVYTYGNVSTDGQRYDLTAQLESTSDPERCEVKNYKFNYLGVEGGDVGWCDGVNYSYSKQIYEASPQ